MRKKSFFNFYKNLILKIFLKYFYKNLGKTLKSPLNSMPQYIHIHNVNFPFRRGWLGGFHSHQPAGMPWIRFSSQWGTKSGQEVSYPISVFAFPFPFQMFPKVNVLLCCPHFCTFCPKTMPKDPSGSDQNMKCVDFSLFSLLLAEFFWILTIFKENENILW